MPAGDTMRLLSRLLLLVALTALAAVEAVEAGPSHPGGLLRERRLSSRFPDPVSFVAKFHRPLRFPDRGHNQPDVAEPVPNPPTTPQLPTATMNTSDDQTGPSNPPDGMPPDGMESDAPGPAGPPLLAVAGVQMNDEDLDLSSTLSLWDDGPSVPGDVPISSAFLALFLAGAVLHGWRCYKVNGQIKDHKRPILSALVLSFCLLRAVTCGLRILLATRPEDDVAMSLEMISVQIGSVVIFVASLILGQRLLKHFSLTSLLHSSWRLVLFWFSKLFLLAAILSAVAIFTLYAVGTGLLASDDDSPVGTSGQLEEGLILLKISVTWLFTFGAVPVLLVFFVVATSRIVPRRKDNLAIKLTVFLLGAVILVTGQGFHIGALFNPEHVGGKIVFYVAGFAFEIVVVMLYALANLDLLFATDRMDSFAQSRETSRSSSEDSAPTDEKPDLSKGAIVARRDFEVFVAKLETTPSGRSPSMIWDGSEIEKSAERIRGFGEHLTSRPGSRKSPPEPLR